MVMVSLTGMPVGPSWAASEAATKDRIATLKVWKRIEVFPVLWEQDQIAIATKKIKQKLPRVRKRWAIVECPCGKRRGVKKGKAIYVQIQVALGFPIAHPGSQDWKAL
jgi:hypothetical protein